MPLPLFCLRYVIFYSKWGGFNNFGSILLKNDFVFTTNKASMMKMPGGGIDIIVPPIVGVLTVKFFNNKRLVPCLIVNLIVVVVFCLLIFTHHKGSELTGSFYLITALVLIQLFYLVLQEVLKRCWLTQFTLFDSAQVISLGLKRSRLMKHLIISIKRLPFYLCCCRCMCRSMCSCCFLHYLFLQT